MDYCNSLTGEAIGRLDDKVVIDRLQGTTHLTLKSELI